MTTPTIIEIDAYDSERFKSTQPGRLPLVSKIIGVTYHYVDSSTILYRTEMLRTSATAHGDLHAANIMVTAKRAAPLEDFGLRPPEVALMARTPSDLTSPTLPWAVLEPESRSPTSDILEKFIEIPGGPNQRHEPVFKGKGVSLWAVLTYVNKRGLTPEQVSDQWSGYITVDEVRAAIQYQLKFPDLIDDPFDDEV